MRIVAHRGLPSTHRGPGDNSLPDLERALRLGLDVEIDVWWLGVEIVVSHDPPLTIHALPTLRDFFHMFARYPGVTAWVNVKCCNMSRGILAAAQEFGVLDRIVTFDHAIPDLIWARRNVPSLPVAYRSSQYDSVKPFYDEDVSWILLDRFHPEGLTALEYLRSVAGSLAWISRTKTVREAKVLVVSPEVHGGRELASEDFNFQMLAWEFSHDPKIYGVLTDRPSIYNPALVESA